jgi:DNA-directed RNA polymerase specialized sigma24 family protein
MYAEEGSQREVRELAISLYREQHSYLSLVARRNARNDADAEEALQEAFISFLQKFDPTRGAPPMAWLTLTLRRQCWRQTRDAHLDRYVGQEAERGGDERGAVLESIPSHVAGTEELVAERDQARRRLAGLKPDQRTGLGLLAAGFTYKEIATRRSWTYTKVDRSIREGRAALATG